MPLTPKHSTRKHKALREFTDREDQTERFRALLRNRDPKKHHVLMFYGVGGVGKTRLQKELNGIHTRECRTTVKTVPKSVIEKCTTQAGSYSPMGGGGQKVTRGVRMDIVMLHLFLTI